MFINQVPSMKKGRIIALTEQATLEREVTRLTGIRDQAQASLDRATKRLEAIRQVTGAFDIQTTVKSYNHSQYALAECPNCRNTNPDLLQLTITSKGIHTVICLDCETSAPLTSWNARLEEDPL